MTVYAINDTKKGRTGIAPTYLQTTQFCDIILRVYLNSEVDREFCYSWCQKYQ